MGQSSESSIQQHANQDELFREELKKRNHEFRGLQNFKREKRVAQDDADRWIQKEEVTRARPAA
ncbi:MAG: hypothetical protein AAB885_00650 [Patescibacteria group bacterium]